MSSAAQKLHASFPSAGFPRRFVSWVYDFLVAVAIIMLASALALLFAALLTTFEWLVLPEGMDHAAWLAQGPWYSLYLLSVVSLFFGWFWKRSGQTLGMRAWRLKLQNRDGSRLTNRQVFIRLITCCAGLGNLWVLVDFKNKRAWHDYAAGTEVVTLSKEANQLFYWNEL
ncbi:MAG: RDD family protein [Idiomarina sp.]|nr:RDD family protein [Idiomarina sp.]